MQFDLGYDSVDKKPKKKRKIDSMLTLSNRISIRSVLCSYSPTDADYAEIPDDDEDADYAHPMAGNKKLRLFAIYLLNIFKEKNSVWWWNKQKGSRDLELSIIDRLFFWCKMILWCVLCYFHCILHIQPKIMKWLFNPWSWKRLLDKDNSEMSTKECINHP